MLDGGGGDECRGVVNAQPAASAAEFARVAGAGHVAARETERAV